MLGVFAEFERPMIRERVIRVRDTTTCVLPNIKRKRLVQATGSADKI
jgi:hypothetical protein